MGKAMKDLGFQDLTGVDLIPKMVEKSKSLGIYRVLKQGNLMAKMEFPDQSFDCLVSVGVTTYLSEFISYQNIYFSFFSILKP